MDPPAGTVSPLMVMLLQLEAFDRAEYDETVQPWASTPNGELTAATAAAMYPQTMFKPKECDVQAIGLVGRLPSMPDTIRKLRPTKILRILRIAVETEYKLAYVSLDHDGRIILLGPFSFEAKRPGVAQDHAINRWGEACPQIGRYCPGIL